MVGFLSNIMQFVTGFLPLLKCMAGLDVSPTVVLVPYSQFFHLLLKMHVLCNAKAFSVGSRAL